MSRSGTRFAIAALALAGCNETAVVLSVHSNLKIPSQLDALCLQIGTAGEQWEFAQRYPLAEEEAGVARTLSVVAGERADVGFDALLRGERWGWPVSFERRHLSFEPRSVKTEDFYLPACQDKRAVTGTGLFSSAPSSPHGTLANGATAVAAMPVAFAPSELVAVTPKEARRFAFDRASDPPQVKYHEAGVPAHSDGAWRLIAIDLDNDCDLDLVVLTSKGVRTWRQVDGGRFEEALSLLSSTDSFAAGAVADLNRDGYKDLVLAGSTAVKLFLSDELNPGRYLDASHKLPPLSAPGAASVAIGLLDGDAHPDIVIARDDSSPSQLLFGDGSGQFLTRGAALADSWTASVAVADLDGDGFHDLVFGASKGASTVQFSDKLGGFASPTTIPGSDGELVRELLAVDVNNDCRVDLVLGGANGVRVVFNRGNRVLESGGKLEPEWRGVTQLVAVDINGDGFLDLAGVKDSGASYHIQLPPGG
jgi:hypothetical protein